MERVETLSNLLAEKIRNKASVQELLLTVKMLESELIHVKNTRIGDAGKAASVHIARKYEKPPSGLQDMFAEPAASEPAPIHSSEAAAPVDTDAKTVEVLQIDEAEVEAELDEIKKNAEERNKISVQNKPQVVFDPVDDIPTLAGRQYLPQASAPASPPTPVVAPKEIHESINVNNSASLNEALSKPQKEVSHSLQDTPVKDLKKAIGVNDRYVFINELFRGDESMYERSIKTINGFAIFPEAEYWIRRELKLKLGWNDKNEIVQQFDQLVRRRFA